MVSVLLINPPMKEGGEFIDGYKGTRPVLPPLGLAYIAAVLEENNHSVSIYDGAVEEDSFEEIAHKAKGYDFIGITTTTFMALQMHRTAEAIKKANPKAVIIVGGPHATVVPFDVLKDPNIDIIVLGEGEYTFLDIINGKPWKAIQGVGFRDGKRIAITELRPLSNLDNLPYPARYLMDMGKYRASELRARRHPALHMMSSRGCPHNCSFCSNKTLHRQQVRFHSPERVVNEMELLIDNFDAKEIHFWDDNMALKKDRLLQICALIKKRNINIPWNCESRIDTMDEERLKAMKDAGCYQISYGIESGSQRILDSVNKGITLDQIRKVIKMTNDLGIETRGYFMFGFVSETLKEMEQTRKFANSLNLDYASFAILVPLPGSLDYERAQKEGTFDPFYWKTQVLSDISFPIEPIYIPKGVTAKQLIAIHRKAIRSFYLTRKQVVKKLKSIKCMDDIKRLAKGAFTILEASK